MFINFKCNLKDNGYYPSLQTYLLYICIHTHTHRYIHVGRKTDNLSCKYLQIIANGLQLQINQREWRLKDEKKCQGNFLKVILTVAIIINCLVKYIEVYFTN